MLEADAALLVDTGRSLCHTLLPSHPLSSGYSSDAVAAAVQSVTRPVGRPTVSLTPTALVARPPHTVTSLAQRLEPERLLGAGIDDVTVRVGQHLQTLDVQLTERL